MITRAYYARYEINVKLGENIGFGTRKAEALEFAQSEANRIGRRVEVLDTNRNAKYWWELIPLSEGAQGIRTHNL